MDVLVVGLGSMGKRRIRLMKRCSKIGKIIGIDGRNDRRREVKEIFNCEVCESIDEALKLCPTIQIAFICTSPLSHNILIESALQHNLHVFTEINLISDGYEENIKLAKKKGLELFLSSTPLYSKEIEFISQKVKSIEKPLDYIYHVGQYLPDWHPWDVLSDFFISNKKTNGCREIFAIELPWIIDVFGDIKNISVTKSKNTTLPIDYDDNYIVVIEHATGHKGVFVADVISRKPVHSLTVVGEELYLSWDGTPHGMFIQDVAKNLLIKKELYTNIEAEQIEGYSDNIVENSYEEEISVFLDVLENKSVARHTFEKDLKILELIDKIEGIK